MSSFGKTLRRLREEAGLNQDEFAEKVGVKSGKQTISRWELGKSEPSLGELRKIAEILHIKLVQLIDDSENEAGQPTTGESKPGFVYVPADEYIDLQRRVIRLQDQVREAENEKK